MDFEQTGYIFLKPQDGDKLKVDIRIRHFISLVNEVLEGK